LTDIFILTARGPSDGQGAKLYSFCTAALTTTIFIDYVGRRIGFGAA